MRSGFLIPLLLGSLGGCALYFDDKEIPADPGDSPDPDPVTPPGPPTPAQQGKALLAEWSGCMSLANFTSAGVAPAWGQLSTATGRKCTGCHIESSPEFPTSSNAEAFFKVISEHALSMLRFFPVDLTTPPFKVILDLRSIEAVGAGTVPHTGHPRFTIAGAPTTTFTEFYDLTVARKAAGECDPPRLKD